MYVYYVDGIYMEKKKDNPYGIEAIPGEYDGQQMRSQLEITWARWLDRHNVPWLYEEAPEGLTGYLPDFCIPIGYHLYTWLEIKPARWDGYPEIPKMWKVKGQRLFKVTDEPVCIVFGEPGDNLQSWWWGLGGGLEGLPVTLHRERDIPYLLREA